MEKLSTSHQMRTVMRVTLEWRSMLLRSQRSWMLITASCCVMHDRCSTAEMLRWVCRCKQLLLLNGLLTAKHFLTMTECTVLVTDIFYINTVFTLTVIFQNLNLQNWHDICCTIAVVSSAACICLHVGGDGGGSAVSPLCTEIRSWHHCTRSHAPSP